MLFSYISIKRFCSPDKALLTMPKINTAARIHTTKVEESPQLTNILFSYEQDEANANHRFSEINTREDLFGHLPVHCQSLFFKV